MSKVFTVDFGGKERVLKFSTSDAREIKRRFNKTVANLLFEDVLGQTGGVEAPPDVESLALLLSLELRTGGTKLASEETVYAWLDEHLKGPGASLQELAVPAVKCAFYSGAVLGYVADLEELATAAANSGGVEPVNAANPGKGDEPEGDPTT